MNSTGDGFFVAFEEARSAIECAIDIQRGLGSLHVGGGPPIAVRIGLRAADATGRGADYSGLGVHVAARVGAAAGPGEILVTAGVLEEAGETGEVDVGDRRRIELRGLTAPVEVASVNWA